jgi:RNA polymerase sigma-70 factor (ECF subfamily)
MPQTASLPPVQPPKPEFSEPLPEQELRDLLQRSCSGDSLAFARLYDHYCDRVYDYARFNLAHEEAADDLAARIFLKAWRSVRCYERARESFSAWLYRVARRELVDFCRANRQPAAPKDIVSPADGGLIGLDGDDLCADS